MDVFEFIFSRIGDSSDTTESLLNPDEVYSDCFDGNIGKYNIYHRQEVMQNKAVVSMRLESRIEDLKNKQNLLYTKYLALKDQSEDTPPEKNQSQIRSTNRNTRNRDRNFRNQNYLFKNVQRMQKVAQNVRSRAERAATVEEITKLQNVKASPNSNKFAEQISGSNARNPLICQKIREVESRTNKVEKLSCQTVQNLQEISNHDKLSCQATQYCQEITKVDGKFSTSEQFIIEPHPRSLVDNSNMTVPQTKQQIPTSRAEQLIGQLPKPPISLKDVEHESMQELPNSEFCKLIDICFVAMLMLASISKIADRIARKENSLSVPICRIFPKLLSVTQLTLLTVLHSVTLASAELCERVFKCAQVKFVLELIKFVMSKFSVYVKQKQKMEVIDCITHVANSMTKFVSRMSYFADMILKILSYVKLQLDQERNQMLDFLDRFQVHVNACKQTCNNNEVTQKLELRTQKLCTVAIFEKLTDTDPILKAHPILSAIHLLCPVNYDADSP